MAPKKVQRQRSWCSAAFDSSCNLLSPGFCVNILQKRSFYTSHLQAASQPPLHPPLPGPWPQMCELFKMPLYTPFLLDALPWKPQSCPGTVYMPVTPPPPCPVLTSSVASRPAGLPSCPSSAPPWGIAKVPPVQHARLSSAGHTSQVLLRCPPPQWDLHQFMHTSQIQKSSISCPSFLLPWPVQINAYWLLDTIGDR